MTPDADARRRELPRQGVAEDVGRSFAELRERLPAAAVCPLGRSGAWSGGLAGVLAVGRSDGALETRRRTRLPERLELLARRAGAPRAAPLEALVFGLFSALSLPIGAGRATGRGDGRMGPEGHSGGSRGSQGHQQRRTVAFCCRGLVRLPAPPSCLVASPPRVPPAPVPPPLPPPSVLLLAPLLMRGWR